MTGYRIVLSSPDVVTSIEQRLPDGRKVRVPARLRNIEIEILVACFSELSMVAENISGYMQCLRAVKTIQSVNDSIQFFDIQKSDMENILLGFKLTSGKRSHVWLDAINLWCQIEKPVQIEIPDPEQVKA